MNNSPKELFLYLGAMISLYLSVVSILILIFQYTNVLFPEDVSRVVSGGNYNLIRFAMASLIVVSPVFLYLSKIIYKDIRENKEKTEIGVRRWFLYLTLFGTGVILLGNLIAVLSAFLGGELTVRFAIKSFSIVFVLGSVFIYYINEIKGNLIHKKNVTGLVGIIFAVLIALLVFAGFFIFGSPQTQRDMRIDTDTIRNIQSINWLVVEYWQQKEELPDNIYDTSSFSRFLTTPKDLRTGEEYTYRVLDDLEFEICATFLTNSEDLRKIRGYWIDKDWDFSEGLSCFELEVSPEQGYKFRSPTPLPREVI